jgi:hypothetical protein
MEHHNFDFKRKKFKPTNKEVCLYLYENKLLCVSKDWSKIWYQDTKLFERLLYDGIIQRIFNKHLVQLLRQGTLECLTLFIKRYPSEYNNYAKQDAIVQSLHNHDLFKFIINDHKINLLTVSVEIIRSLYKYSLEIATVETIDYLFHYLTHTKESLRNDLIFALDHLRTDVCDFILDKINQLCPSQNNPPISTSEYWGELNFDSLIWLRDKIPGSIKWQEILLRDDCIFDIYSHDRMALLYFMLEDLYKHRTQIDQSCKFFERNWHSYIYRHHIKLYKALRQ